MSSSTATHSSFMPSQSDGGSSGSGASSLWRRSSARLGHAKRPSKTFSNASLGEFDATSPPPLPLSSTLPQPPPQPLPARPLNNPDTSVRVLFPMLRPQARPRRPQDHTQQHQRRQPIKYHHYQALPIKYYHYPLPFPPRTKMKITTTTMAMTTTMVTTTTMATTTAMATFSLKPATIMPRGTTSAIFHGRAHCSSATRAPAWTATLDARERSASTHPLPQPHRPRTWWTGEGPGERDFLSRQPPSTRKHWHPFDCGA